MEEMRALKQALLNEYGHFADKRIKVFLPHRPHFADQIWTIL
jgi:hypothetical protein